MPSQYKQNHRPERRRVQQSIIKLYPVSNAIALSRVITRLSDYSSITGIIRTADYRMGIVGDTIYLFIANSTEAERLLEQERIWIDGQLTHISDPALVLGIAVAHSIYTPSEVEQIARALPFTCSIFEMDVRQEPDPSMNTRHAIEAFEEIQNNGGGRLVGFKFAYEERGGRIRNFGTLFILQTVREKLDMHRSATRFNGEEMSTGQASSVPILLDRARRNVLTNNRCYITPQTAALNRLCDNTAHYSEEENAPELAPHWISHRIAISRRENQEARRRPEPEPEEEPEPEGEDIPPPEDNLAPEIQPSVKSSVTGPASLCAQSTIVLAFNQDAKPAGTETQPATESGAGPSGLQPAVNRSAKDKLRKRKAGRGGHYSTSSSSSDSDDDASGMSLEFGYTMDENGLITKRKPKGN